MYPKKERIIKDAKVEYIKRMKSPAYVKQVKRNIEMFNNYNMNFCNSNLDIEDLKEAAHYFAGDIKNPIVKPTQILDNKTDTNTNKSIIT